MVHFFLDQDPEAATGITYRQSAESLVRAIRYKLKELKTLPQHQFAVNIRFAAFEFNLMLGLLTSKNGPSELLVKTTGDTPAKKQHTLSHIIPLAVGDNIAIVTRGVMTKIPSGMGRCKWLRLASLAVPVPEHPTIDEVLGAM
jgi:hypothetical protein